MQTLVDTDPLILYRSNSGQPAIPVPFSELPDDEQADLARAFGPIKTCVSCQHCRVPAGAGLSGWACLHPQSVHVLDGRPRSCDSMRLANSLGACGIAGELWGPISGA